jgi:hypothetical protein
VNLNRPKNLELLIETCRSLVHRFDTKNRLHEFLQQKCLFVDIHVKRHIPYARFGQHQESPGGGKGMENLFIATEDIVIAPRVRETASDDGAVLLDIEQGICFGLNPVGLKIWELLKTHHSVDEIADDLAQDFLVSRSQLLCDVVEFLQSLEAKRLIRRSGHTVPTRSWLTRVFPWAKQHTQPY